MFRFLFLLLFLVFLFACSNEDSPNGVDDSSSSEESGNNSSSSVKDSESSSSNDDGESSSSSESDSKSCSSGIVVSGNLDKGSYATLPSNQNMSKIREMYDAWINIFYVTYEQDLEDGSFIADMANPNAPGTARIKASYNGSSDGSRTCSEAIGYGMLLMALMDDFEKLDKLFAYSKLFRVNGTALMKWDVRTFSTAVGGSATDADIDILSALLIAYEKTNNQSYLDGALEIAASIYELEVDASTKLILPAVKTERLGNGNIFNISYISLPALKMLAHYDKDRNWNAVFDANFSYVESVQNNGAGLWPDWSDANGAPIDPANNSNTILTADDGSKVNSYESYYKETPRIPWRIAWHYHWFNDDESKAMLDKGFTFLQSKDVSVPQDIKDFYKYSDGLASSKAGNAERWISLCALGMGSSDNQDWLNSCNTRILGTYNPSLAGYYGNTLRLIYAMLFNGAF